MVERTLGEATKAPDWSDFLLRSIGRSVTVALAEGAERLPDPAGCLALVRPDGRPLFVSPGIFAKLTEAGLPPSVVGPQQRPPSWSDPLDLPLPGAWCGCCGKFARTGGRWWCEATAPTGWCCWDCHPPVHLAAAEVREVRT